MIGLSKLLTQMESPSDSLRYGRPGVQVHRFAEGGRYRPVVVWNVTSACNLFCTHCYYSARTQPDPRELSTEEALAVIDDLGGLGVPVILFSGGEPLMREDLFTLTERAAAHGIRVSLSTNGTLITPEVARKLVDHGVRYIGISLDGRPETHDRFRKVEGAFEQALRGIEAAMAQGVRVSVRFTVTAQNADDLLYLLDLSDRMGVPRFCIYHLVYSGRGKRLTQGDLTAEEKRRLMDGVIERAYRYVREGNGMEILTVDSPADGVFLYLWLLERDPAEAERVRALLEAQGGDGTGMRIAEIDHLGNVHPNQFWLTHTLGNVRERPFSEIWHDESDPILARLRRRPRDLKGRCGRCAYREWCGGFRPRALGATGDPWDGDPGCYLTEEEISGAREAELKARYASA